MSTTTFVPLSESREQDDQVVPSPPQVYGYADPPLPFELGSIVSDVTHNLDYNLVAPLGNGSYAIVYLVQEVKTGKLFALKCLSKMSLTEEQLNVQANEMTIHRSLPKHPRIVQFLNSFETSEWLFLLLEYIVGTDLYWWITQKSDQYDHTGHKLKERERLDIVRGVFKQCLEAVGAVHEAGIAHRDLKPENFLITKDHRVKLSDFGLSTNEKYSTDFDCGSKPYMSYECRNPITPTYNPIPADIWSLGIIFLNLIWHRSPWSDPDPHSCAAFAAFQNDKVGFLLQRFEGMPESVAKFLAHRVFCPVEEGRVKIKEWKKWCDKLVELMEPDDSASVSDMIVPRTGTDKDQVTQPPTKRRTLGFSPLSLTMSALKSSKSRESTISPKSKKTSLFPIISPSTTSPSSSLDQQLASVNRDQQSTTPVGSRSSLDGGKASWSEAFDFDASGEMDFSQPIVFDDGVSIRVRSDSTDSKLSEKRTNVGGERDEDEVRSDNDSGFATDEMEETPKLDDASVDVLAPAIDDTVPSSTQATPVAEEDEAILLAPPSLSRAASRPTSPIPVQIVAESSVPKPVASLSAKPPSRILKYIPPKISVPFSSRQHDKSHHQSSTHLPPHSPAILIPSGRPDRRNPQTAPSFEDSSAAMASSFGGHGINVGGYAYQRRPFAPPPPAWRADKGNYNSFGKKRGAREYGNDNGKRSGRNPGAYGNDGNNYSYARSGRSNEWNPWGNEASSSSQAYRGKRSGEYQRPSSYERHHGQQQQQGGSQRDYFVPQRQDNSNRNSKQRKRSSTVSSSSTVFQMDSVSVFNNRMPGMTTYQSLKGRAPVTTTTGFATSSASGNTLAVPATPASFTSRNSIFAGSNATSISLNIIPPTPIDETRADPIATAAPFLLKTRRSSPALAVPRISAPAPLERIDNRYAEMQEKDVVFGYDDDEVTLNGGDAAATGKRVGWDDELVSGEGEDEHGEDGKLKVLGKSTMVEFTRLLKGIVGYNRGVKVGGEGKDVKV